MTISCTLLIFIALPTLDTLDNPQKPFKQTVINVLGFSLFVFPQARNHSNASTKAATDDSPTHPIGRSIRMYTHPTNPTIAASMAVISRTRTHHRCENT